jgi:hypothetical protein
VSLKLAARRFEKQEKKEEGKATAEELAKAGLIKGKENEDKR